MLMMLLYILSIFNSFESLPAEIKTKLENEFRSHKKVEYSIVKPITGYKSVEFKNDEDINVIGSTAYIPVNVIDKNGKCKRTTLSVRVKVFDDVFVAVENIDKWNKLKASDFQLVEKEVTSLRGEEVHSIGEIIGKRADRFIKKGEILTIESIEEMPAVYPGDKLEAHTIVGNVKISFATYSKQEGIVGEIIRVRNSKNKIFKAEVIDNNNVLIVE